MSNSLVHIEGVSKSFGTVEAVKDVSLEIDEGEFFALLGPSGCGKTTLLRMLAGLEVPSAGRIVIDGIDMARVPPNRRSVNMVFQSYAVFPHMNVEDNVGYGLKVEGVGSQERGRRVRDALELVKLGEYGDRMPNQLSGGQRQRVALARALVKRPQVLLLDEPLSALDAKLREAMRLEMARIQQAVGVTFVMVTHDQTEALAMASRCALMEGGFLRQVATPRDLYNAPATRFVADFIGSINLFEASPDEGAARGRVSCPALGTKIFIDRYPDGAAQGSVWIGIRPEMIGIIPFTAGQPDGERSSDNSTRISGRVHHAQYLGSEYAYDVVLETGTNIRVVRSGFDQQRKHLFAKDDLVWLSWTSDCPIVLLS